MCYELFFKKQKSAQDQQADRAAPVTERVPAAKPQVQRQPVTRTIEEQETEAELEIMGTA